jgi:multidrug efflux pump subunit AcrB
VPQTLDNYESALHTLYEGAALAVIVVFSVLRDIRAHDHRGHHPAAVDLSGLLGHGDARFFAQLGQPAGDHAHTGILVDDAIVEIENIVRHIRMGKSPYQAALEAADEIGLAVIAISLTIVAVFMPASFMSSIPGSSSSNSAFTVSVQVLFSLLCARHDHA